MGLAPGAAGVRPEGLAWQPEPMPGKLRRQAVLAAVLTSLVFAAAWLGASGASAPAETRTDPAATPKVAIFVRKGKQVYFDVSDTGDPASFGEFSEAVSKHPAVIESFRAWGSDVRDSIQRWEIAPARPTVHLTNPDPQTRT